jgi:hypothetical protein
VVNITDDFNRADEDPLTNATTSEPWVTQLGSIGVQTNKAHTYALSGGNAISTIEAGVADVEVVCVMTAVANNSTTGGLVFRYVDNSNYWRYIDKGNADGSVVVTKRVAGVNTDVFDSGPTAAVVPFELKIIADGNDIEVWLDGSLVDSFTDSFNATATKHGLFSSGGTPTMDDFSIVSL